MPSKAFLIPYDQELTGAAIASAAAGQLTWIQFLLPIDFTFDTLVIPFSSNGATIWGFGIYDPVSLAALARFNGMNFAVGNAKQKTLPSKVTLKAGFYIFAAGATNTTAQSQVVANSAYRKVVGTSGLTPAGVNVDAQGNMPGNLGQLILNPNGTAQVFGGVLM